MKSPFKVEIVETREYLDINNYITNDSYTKSIYIFGLKIFERTKISNSTVLNNLNTKSTDQEQPK